MPVITAEKTTNPDEVGFLTGWRWRPLLDGKPILVAAHPRGPKVHERLFPSEQAAVEYARKIVTKATA
jgi:hypothetical protein